MFYCTLTLNREQYEKIKDMPAELVLQSLKIPYVAYLDKTSEGPALERVYDGNKIIERDLDS